MTHEGRDLRRVFDIVFTACASIVLLMCIGSAVLAHFVDDGEEAVSYLEGREYQQRPDFSIDAYVGHAYQDQFEQYVADLTPNRDEVLLMSASLQRVGIESANLLFGYSAYHTFYGSEYLAICGYEAVVEPPTKRSKVSKAFLAKRAKMFGNVMREYPQINWQFALADRSRNSVANPAHNLVSDVADYPYYRSAFLAKLPNKCNSIDLGQDSTEAYLERYYHTDHHWQVNGALEAYHLAMDGFGRKAPEIDEPVVVYDGPFYGSEARSGLDATCWDVVWDVKAPVPDWRVSVDGDIVDVSWLNESFQDGFVGYEKTNRFSNAYAEHFHDDVGQIHIRNLKGTGALLIVGDSFTNPIDYLFGYSYRDVYILDTRHYKGKLRTFMKKHSIDDALFLMGSKTLRSQGMARFLR